MSSILSRTRKSLRLGAAVSVALGLSGVGASAQDGGRTVEPVADTQQLLFFAAPEQAGDSTFFLWASDGTRRGTQSVRASVVRDPLHVTAVGGGMVIFSGTATRNDTGDEPWVSDGTRDGTRLLRDIVLNTSSSPRYFAPLGNGQVVFSAFTFEAGRELWITDLSRGGTRLLVDIVPGNSAWNGDPREMTAIGNGLALFTAYTPTHGREVWVTDGTAEGTQMLADLFPANNGQGDSSDTNPTERFWIPTFIPTGDGRAFFRHSDADGPGLWITDGTLAGTQRLNAAGLNATPGLPVPLAGGRWLFSATQAGFRGTFVTDGSPAGTVELLPDGARLFGNTNAAAALGDGRVVFAATTAETGTELWITDGTSNRTRLRRDIWPGSNGSLGAASRFASLGDGRVLFTASDPDSTGWELFITDGTRRGTRLLRDINPVSGSLPTRYIPLADGRVAMVANDGTRGAEVWISNGRRSGTRLLRDITPGGGGPRGLTSVLP
ncbi:MAG: hypothetical protein H6898_14320 [Rhodobacter sp.]|nr:hypothetical protein [Paracoccaceae bacterium]MCC0077732.1 hypothetical protein [Rhodobacter sp.]